MKQQDTGKQPFFAQFLEAQKSTLETAAAPFVDDGPFITKPLLDMEHTMKYPSDGDEV